MKKWHTYNSEKSEISEILEKLFQVFDFPYSQHQKLGFKNLGKNLWDSRGFWVFDLASKTLLKENKIIYVYWKVWM